MLPCDRAGLWMKAKAHINRSFAALDSSDFEQAALWSASALELLAKAALAKVSPLLVADPADDGKSLLIAAGLVADTSRFKSIPAKGLFSRCDRVFRGFSAQEAGWIAAKRNEELHSALSPFASIDADTWWERYWSQAVILIHAQDAELADFVGTSREPEVESHLARNRENVDRRVQALVERAQHRFRLAEESEDAWREIVELNARPGFLADFQDPTRCPACTDFGSLLGDAILDAEVEYDDEGWAPTEHVVIAAEAFECEACGLRLHGLEYVEAAGLPDSFQAEREFEPVYDDYGND